MLEPLTPRQLDALEYIAEYTKLNRLPPTYDEMGAALGVSKVTAFQHVAHLLRKGYLRSPWPGTARGLVLTHEGKETIR